MLPLKRLKYASSHSGAKATLGAHSDQLPIGQSFLPLGHLRSLHRAAFGWIPSTADPTRHSEPGHSKADLPICSINHTLQGKLEPLADNLIYLYASPWTEEGTE